MIAIAKIQTTIDGVRNYKIFDGKRLVGVMTNAYGNPDRTADKQKWNVYSLETSAPNGGWDNAKAMSLSDALDALNESSVIEGFHVRVVHSSAKSGTLVSCRSNYGFKMYVAGINATTRAPILSGHRDDAFRFTKEQARGVMHGLFYHQSLPVLGDNYALVYTEEAIRKPQNQEFAPSAQDYHLAA